MKNIIFFFLITISLTNKTYSQTTVNQTEGKDSIVFEAEKLFLHTDKDFYLMGDTLRYKGYLTNSSYLSFAPTSKYIYVELYSDTLISRVKTVYSDNGFSGYIRIDDKLSSGLYTIRCYTQNMMNYPAEYMFHKHIRIMGKDFSTAPLIDDTQQAKYDIDVQFLPESGRYLTNKQSKIAFKAVNSLGGSANVNVTLYDKRDSLIGQFKTRHDGMGLITLIEADPLGYYAVVNDTSGFTKTIELPQPLESGTTISVNRVRDIINIYSYSNTRTEEERLVIKNGSEELISKLLLPGNSKNEKVCNLVLSPSSLPYGLISAQIQNSKGEISAERLFFIKNPSRPEIEVNLDKKEYDTRERVEMTILLKDKSGKPLSGEFSVSVTDRFLAPLSSYKDNIVSYMELSSELKGSINNPAFYFETNSAETDKLLDLVMMTNGWRNHTRSLKSFKREYNQEISGSVAGIFRKEAKNTTLMVFAPSIGLQQAYILEKKSSFTIEGLDFPDNTKFLLGVVGKGGGQLFGLKIIPENFMPLSVYSNTIEPKKEKELIKTTTSLYSSILSADMNLTLNEIVVKAPAKEMFKPKYNPSPFLTSFHRGQIKEREELELYDNMSLMDYVVANFGGLTIGSGNNGRAIHSSRGVTFDGPGEPFLYVDCIKWNNTTLLDDYGMTVYDAENVAFLKGTEGAIFNTINGVILITTRKGKGGAQNSAPINVAKITPLGYQLDVLFYSPKYETAADKESIKPDLRSTLYWNPSIQTDKNGSAKLVFYTGDRKPKLDFSLQGVTNSGEFVVSETK